MSKLTVGRVTFSPEFLVDFEAMLDRLEPQPRLLPLTADNLKAMGDSWLTHYRRLGELQCKNTRP